MELPIGAAVVCQDGEVGRLKYVAVDPATNAITDLIVEHGVVLKRDDGTPTVRGRSWAIQDGILDEP